MDKNITYILQNYRKIKKYLKTCKYFTWFTNLCIIFIIILSVYTIIIKIPIYSCYQEAKFLGHDLDIIVLTDKGCGTIIKDKFIPLKEL